MITVLVLFALLALAAARWGADTRESGEWRWPETAGSDSGRPGASGYGGSAPLGTDPRPHRPRAGNRGRTGARRRLRRVPRSPQRSMPDQRTGQRRLRRTKTRRTIEP